MLVWLQLVTAYLSLPLLSSIHLPFLFIHSHLNTLFDQKLYKISVTDVSSRCEACDFLLSPALWKSPTCEPSSSICHSDLWVPSPALLCISDNLTSPQEQLLDHATSSTSSSLLLHDKQLNRQHESVFCFSSSYGAIFRNLIIFYSGSSSARHGKNNTASSVFTHAERLMTGNGSKKQRFTAHSMAEFDSCRLCLHTARDPRVDGEGHLFCHVNKPRLLVSATFNTA